MSPELTSKLIEKFKPITGNNFYFECDDGWYYLIHNMLIELQSLSNIKLSQVKQKFGALRVYIDEIEPLNISTSSNTIKTDGKSDIEKAYSIANKFEHDSTYICETCGATGKIQNIKGWLTCTCGAH